MTIFKIIKWMFQLHIHTYANGINILHNRIKWFFFSEYEKNAWNAIGWSVNCVFFAFIIVPILIKKQIPCSIFSLMIQKHTFQSFWDKKSINHSFYLKQYRRVTREIWNKIIPKNGCNWQNSNISFFLYEFVYASTYSNRYWSDRAAKHRRGDGGKLFPS